MSKYSLSKSAFPPEVVRMLRELGEGLRIARLRRRQSQVDFAERLMVSRATLQRMERGDPSVALGAWVSAAWLLQRLSDLQHVFDPDFDEAVSVWSVATYLLGVKNHKRLDWAEATS